MGPHYHWSCLESIDDCVRTYKQLVLKTFQLLILQQHGDCMCHCTSNGLTDISVLAKYLMKLPAILNSYWNRSQKRIAFQVRNGRLSVKRQLRHSNDTQGRSPSTILHLSPICGFRIDIRRGPGPPHSVLGRSRSVPTVDSWVRPPDTTAIMKKWHRYSWISNNY